MRLFSSLNKKNVKISSLIFVHTLVVLIVFLFIIFTFFKSVSTASQSEKLYTISEKVVNEIKYNKDFQISSDDLTPISDYNNRLLNTLTFDVIPYVLGFFVFLFLSTTALWLVLHTLQKKNDLKIIQQLKLLEGGEAAFSDNPALHNAYNMIRQKFVDNMNDFKRLHFYLSHDQKNALAILQTSLELSGHTEYNESLSFIKNSIDDVLTLGEMIDGNVKTTVDVPIICAEVCDRYSSVTDNISFDFSEEGSAEVYAKERWISRAVSNLLDNAVKYGEGNPINVYVETKNNTVIITVEDHGIGIPEEKLDAIFAYNFRVDELNKDGYGIGLSLISHVCNLCGGYAFVESKEGKGSKFYLALPQKRTS